MVTLFDLSMFQKILLTLLWPPLSLQTAKELQTIKQTLTSLRYTWNGRLQSRQSDLLVARKAANNQIKIRNPSTKI